ncbi:hypothetical protein HDU83_007938 [Entophlyctis luteolus]|nr:hypothetical protein HDU83_007938 [Entophlyctis luteolus]
MQCPVCNVDLPADPRSASAHANACLDRDGAPVPVNEGASDRDGLIRRAKRPRTSGSEAVSALPTPPARQCPWYKKVPGCGFCVDAFSYGPVPDCVAYFLSHFHSDHYMGLGPRFHNHTDTAVYCSKITANLLISQLRVRPEFVRPLPIGEPIQLGNAEVTLIDANHCPGSVIFVFRVSNLSDSSTKTYLHTGDFRFSPTVHTANPLLRQPFDAVYLDTTYCNPAYTFPAQQDVVAAIVDFVLAIAGPQPRRVEDVVKGHAAATLSNKGIMQRFLEMGSVAPLVALPKANSCSAIASKRTLVCVGTYKIGKERVFKAIAAALKAKVFADKAKRTVLACLEDAELDAMLTDCPGDAVVHVVNIGDLKKESLEEKLKSLAPNFSQLVAVRPTGWTYQPAKSGSKSKSDVMESQAAFSVSDINVTKASKNIYTVALPYSEHSSFTELREFVRSVDAKQIIPTVNVAKHEEMRTTFQQWKSIV